MFETPTAVARTLAQHAPLNPKQILEPAVGRGRLLTGLVDTGRIGTGTSVIAFDKDSKALADVDARHGQLFGRRLKLIQADFLTWAETTSRSYVAKFDCIIMNPPFCSRMEDLWKPRCGDPTVPAEAPKTGFPIEVAFLLQCVSMLSLDGVLLAVLPSSIVTAERLKWLRVYVSSIGTLTYLDRLPSRTFPGVEGRTHLITFTKLRGPAISNSQDSESTRERAVPSLDTIGALDNSRIDVGHVFASRQLAKCVRDSPALRWTKLGQLVGIQRGAIESPMGARRAVHTRHFRDGFWKLDAQRCASVLAGGERALKEFDLLIARVGRNCSGRVGLHIGLTGFACSDCVLVLSPVVPRAAKQLLFALRIVLLWSRSGDLLERGTGATYITSRELRELVIPRNAYKIFESRYRKYLVAVRRMDLQSMYAIELDVRDKLGLTGAD